MDVNWERVKISGWFRPAVVWNLFCTFNFLCFVSLIFYWRIDAQWVMIWTFCNELLFLVTLYIRKKETRKRTAVSCVKVTHFADPTVHFDLHPVRFVALKQSLEPLEVLVRWTAGCFRLLNNRQTLVFFFWRQSLTPVLTIFLISWTYELIQILSHGFSCNWMLIQLFPEEAFLRETCPHVYFFSIQQNSGFFSNLAKVTGNVGRE